MATDKKTTQILADLAPVLLPDEEVLRWSTGMAKVKRMGTETDRRGTLLVTDRRVGIFTKKLGGHDLLDFAYGLLTSVQYKKGITCGEITLLAAGDSAHFRMIPKAEVESIAQTIRHRMAAAHDHSGAGPVAEAAPVSVADEIAKLGELKTAGLLTEVEFAAEKARLLGR